MLNSSARVEDVDVDACVADVDEDDGHRLEPRADDVEQDDVWGDGEDAVEEEELGLV